MPSPSAQLAAATLPDTLYRHHQPWLTSWLRHRLGCRHRAEDLSQDTFLRLLARPDLMARAEIRPLLTTIAKGLMIDQYRRAALERAYHEALAALPPAYSPSAEEQLALLETLVEIDRLLDGLPGLVRRAFLMSQLDGMTYPDIARELGISVSSVQKYMARALKACYAVRYDAEAEADGARP